jgi:hypothetical protein
MENVNVRMPTHIKKELAKKAEEDARSLSNYLLLIITEHYKKVKTK